MWFVIRNLYICSWYAMLIKRDHVTETAASINTSNLISISILLSSLSNSEDYFHYFHSPRENMMKKFHNLPVNKQESKSKVSKRKMWILNYVSPILIINSHKIFGNELALHLCKPFCEPSQTKLGQDLINQISKRPQRTFLRKHK